MKLGIDFDRVAEEVRAVAKERSGYVFTDRCVNIENGQPRCILGHAYVRSGIDPEKLEKTYSNNDVHNIYYIEKYYYDDEEKVVPHPADYPTTIQWLKRVQELQDTKTISWGEAVKQADTEFYGPFGGENND